MFFFGSEIAPQRWRDTPDLQKSRCHIGYRHFFRKDARRFRIIFRVVSGDCLEGGIHAVPVFEPDRRQTSSWTARLGVVLTKLHKMIAVGERTGAQENRCDGGKNRAYGGNPPRESCDYRHQT